MSKSRRNFIKSVGTAGAVSTLPVAGAAFSCDNKDTASLAGTDISPFQQAVGEKVTLTDAEGISHKATITEVQEMEFECAQHKRPAHLPKCANVVRFELDDAGELAGDVYRLKHSTLGKMDLLLSAVPDKTGVVGLEAVFN